MRTILIFLSIGLFLTLIQYSTGAPRIPVSLETDEDDSVENNVQPFSDSQDDESDESTSKSKSIESDVNESDQSSEEKERIVEALELTQKAEERDSESDEQDDDQPNVASAFKNNYGKILRDSDED